MALLTAYCDASGSTSPAKVFTLAGWIGDAQAWADLDNRWKGVLPDGLRAFHMREFAHCRGNFEGWSEAERRELMGELLEILCSSRLIGSVAFSVNRAWFHHSIDPETERWIGGLIGFSITEFAAAAKSFLGNVAHFQVLAPNPQVAVVMESGDRYSGYVAGEFNNAQDISPFVSFRLAPKEACVPLQAADLLAWEVAKQATERTKNPAWAKRHPLAVLESRTSNHWMEYRTEADLVVRIRLIQALHRGG